ncbi:glucose-6-phosphate isomerase [Cupriavidus sp. USMAA2-4]|uniref:glucose-6-phosphate isomerase n=1 Tax=unclassified Cupriavidus TaxID=2640874 RepID=UPI0008A69688|nr:MULTISPECIES: glucose-6-phosphate isomerase [unclassified Cupriavidus]AOY90596.1 glucose-6-phosphate isomerase [Cupriavidus sp. USMAA2-4]AOY99778.1 glucose-6-phosphate isomerase [Cupriavidus sp. USMAHM13]
MPTNLHAWDALQQHHEAIREQQMRDWFDAPDAGQRVAQFSLEAAGLYLDYAKNRVTPQTLALLMQLADEAGLNERRDAMFAGDQINATEHRAALHMALRALPEAGYQVDGAPVMPAIQAVRERMRDFSERVRGGQWTGASGKRITDVINLGIGGSDLGPRMVCRALAHLPGNRLRLHFVSNVDGTELAETLSRVDPEHTLVIVCSKTFTTLETMANAGSARRWFLDNGVAENQLSRHFVAVSTNVEAVRAFGIDPANMFEFWDWVGGRFSLWSSVGLSIVLALGYDAFAELLAGGRAMDEHFRTAPLPANMPVVMAMLGIWYRNFCGMSTSCLAPYSTSLELFPAFLQQLEMESNGKSVQLDGRRVHAHTSPVVWGSAGTNGQHAYFQMIHQGSQIVPVDFIAPLRPPRALPGHHAKLLANCFAQAEALMRGRTAEEVRAGGTADDACVSHMVFDGNRPSNTLLMQDVTPHTLGALIALYEHRTFVQGVIWNINSFDQWGVELGKLLARPIEAELNGAAAAPHDASTTTLIARARAALGSA